MVTIILDSHPQCSPFLTSKMRDVKDKHQMIWKPLKYLLKFYINYNDESYDSDDEFYSDSESDDDLVVMDLGVNLEYYIAVTTPDIIKDRTFILKMICKSRKLVDYANLLRVWNDKGFVKEVLNCHPCYYEHISDELKKDKEMLLISLVDGNSKALEFASADLRNDREIALIAIERVGSGAFKHLSLDLRGDPDIVLKACRREKEEGTKSEAIIYASESLRNDREYFMKIIQINGDYLYYAGPEVRDDKKLVLEAIANNGNALQYTKTLRFDRDFVMEAVKTNPLCLSGASFLFLEDRELVLCAVNQNGWALRSASEKLRNDREIVMCAVKSCGSAIQFVSDRLKNDPEIIREALKQNENVKTIIYK